MRERTLERTLKELELHFSSRFQFRAKFQISTCPNLNRRLSLDGSPVCVRHHFTVHDSSEVIHSLTLTLTQFASTRRSDRRRRSRPGDADAHRRRRERRGRPRGVVGSTLEPVSTGFEITRSLIRPESNSDRIGRVERGADETALVSTIRRTRSDPTKEDPTKEDPMATRGSRERKPPAKVRRVDRSRANEKEKGCIERTLRSSVVSCRSRLKTMIWIDLD